MGMRTHRNGGSDALTAVADSWAKGDHNFPMSDLESEKQTVGFVKRMMESSAKAGPAIPDPRNIHQG